MAALDLTGYDVKISETFGYTNSYEKLLDILKEYQEKTKYKFTKYKSTGGFGNLEVDKTAHRVQWNHLGTTESAKGKVEFDGIPFLILGCAIYDCKYGRDRSVSSKRKFREKTELIEGHKRRRRLTPSRKLGCPTQIVAREVVKFPEFQLGQDADTKKRRLVRSGKLRAGLQAGTAKGEKRFYIKFPNPEDHTDHPNSEPISLEDCNNTRNKMDKPPPLNEIVILQEGYAFLDEQEQYRATCTITLINTEEFKIIVDTGNPWDKEKLLQSLENACTDPADVKFVICTHGHSDHVGNMNLFPNALFIVGSDISHKPDVFLDDSFKDGKIFQIKDNEIEVFPTPGHTHNDVSVLVRNTQYGNVVIAGDLFERANDDHVWESNSFSPEKQKENRDKVLAMADYIVPGHGPPFTVQNVTLS